MTFYLCYAISESNPVVKNALRLQVDEQMMIGMFLRPLKYFVFLLHIQLYVPPT
jgi:hypothetical protein